jgi:ABC-type transport system substrate-binding protein
MTEAPTEMPTEAPTAMATEAPTEAMAAFEPLSLEAPNCDYGGKIKSIKALDQYTVEFAMCKPDPAFLAKAAFTPFGIYPEEWIKANANEANKETLISHPIGTGPYMLDQWNRGDSVVFKRFDDYWGDKAKAETAVLRWATEPAARLLELQAGTVDMTTALSPDDYASVENDPNLQLIRVENPNVVYLALNNTKPPFDNQQVRQAIAMGIDRQRIVDNFYPEGSEVAQYFTPCAIPNGCEGDPWYDFNPEEAKKMLADAGFPNGFKTSLFYRDVSRVYLPEAGPVAVELQTQLKQNLNIDVEVVVMESGEFIDESTNGRLDGLYLLGWGADYPHVTNFLDFHFGQGYNGFGTPYPEIYQVLQEASQIGEVQKAAPLYEQANNAIRDLVPMVPVAHAASADAALASLNGAYTPPFGATNFALLDAGKDTLVFMQNAEPISLYCADESDGESLRPCQQINETLYFYKTDSGDTVPGLATSCDPNADSTVWTCTLREGVKFHDGSDFDANDVVTSWTAGLDASSPYHVGNTGSWEYYTTLWDQLMNAGQ